MLVIPFGGCGEFGRNLTAYVANGTMLFVDCGIQMPDDTSPGVEHLIPDFAPLIHRFGPPAGLLLTHGHEDHIGAVGYLLRSLPSPLPVYGRPLTLYLAERRLERLGVEKRARDFRELTPQQPVCFGTDETPNFTVTPLAMPHSIPEACALLIASHEAGGVSRRVLHTGDYKLDEMGSFELDAAVDLVVGDSTNAGVDGRTGSERGVSEALAVLAEDRTRGGRLAVALFSSHIERIAHFAEACRRGGRKLCLLGRGLHDTTAAAARAGVLALPDNVLCSIDEAATLPPHMVALLCTGTQGERVAALGRLAAALEPGSRPAFGALRLGAGDTVVLSARTIPGHERPVGRLIDRLILAGVDVLAGPPYTVSGHGSRDDLRDLLRAACPRALLPVHGTMRQLHAHAELAEALGIPALRCLDGDIIDLGEPIAVKDRVPARALYVDGHTVGEIGAETLQMRQRLHFTGVVAVAPDPTSPASAGRFVVRTLGVSDAGPGLDALCREAADNAAEAVRLLREKGGREGSAMTATILRAVRNTFARRRGVKPTVLPVLVGPEVGYDEYDDSAADSLV
jgi:ribonuclease J